MEKLFDLLSGSYFRNGGGLHMFLGYTKTSTMPSSLLLYRVIILHWKKLRPTIHTAVPSRTYSEHDSLTLAGLRFGIKDLFAIEGLRTSAGSRSYYDFYPPCPRTAKSINMLLSNGAIIVGKTRNTQFANGEDPQEWIDYSCPWNPRGTT